MSLNFCDLLVLGSDLSGLMAATLLARRGLNVLVLDDEDDRIPAPNLATGLDSRSFKSLMGKLMIPDSKLQILEENTVTTQIVLPRHRLDLPPSRPGFLKEVEREFPSEKALLEDLFGEADRLREGVLDDLLSLLPVVGRKERNRFLKFFKRIPGQGLIACWERLSPELQVVLRCQIRFLARGPLMEPLLVQCLLFLLPESDKTFTIRGGVRELKKIFFEKIDYFGGTVHPLGEEDFGFVTKRAEVRGIQLARYDFPTRCRYCLANLDLPRLKTSIPRTLRTFWTRRELGRLSSAEERYRAVYEIPREALPGPMRENLLYITDPASDLDGANYLEMNVQPVAKTSGELCHLTVTYRLLPAGAGSQPRSRATLEELQQEIEKRIHRLIPFADHQLRRLYPHPAAEGGLFPDSDPSPELEKTRQVAFVPSPFSPPLTSPFKNLFVLGPNVLDWLGTEGKMLAALRGIDLVWSRELKNRGN